jgi:glycerate kinase
MNILIACDSFKDALAAPAVCEAIERGLQRAFGTKGSLTTKAFPLADGGEGMAAILHHHLGLRSVEVAVHDALFRPIQATYSISADGNTAFIEMAQAAGLQLLKEQERNVLKTSTYGVGEIIADAIQKGAKRIVVGLGGSATNDLGMGMATALGWRFFDQNGQELIANGENLLQIAEIIPPSKPLPESIIFETMSDVANPLLGETGAAGVYAPQKGADAKAVDYLERGAKNFVTHAHKIRVIDDAAKGMGAAGGLGYGAAFFLGAKNHSGIDMMLNLTGFDAEAAKADVIITGEGKLDSQTANGKLIAGIVTRAQQKPVIALCGALMVDPEALLEMGLTAAFSIAQGPGSLVDAIALTAFNLEQTAFNVGRILSTK